LLFLFLILIRDIFIALKVILVIRFPWVFTDIAKVFTTTPSPTIAIHEITSHRSLYSLSTRGTDFCINHNPFYICIIFFNHNFPFFYLFAHRGFMVAVFTFKAKFRFALASDVLFGPIFILNCELTSHTGTPFYSLLFCNIKITYRSLLQSLYFISFIFFLNL
jgi:hypothetical protein